MIEVNATNARIYLNTFNILCSYVVKKIKTHRNIGFSGSN